MTDRDDKRVAKALQGADFPAERASLVRYAEDRGAERKTLHALRTIPDGRYERMQQVIDAIPQQPEGEQNPGGVFRQ